MHTNDDDEPPNPRERSSVADDIADLKSTVVKLAEERERLPQPMFWSLFHSRLEGIKKHKELTRLLDAALGGSTE
jgi:hypothetical protein